ncbi:MAG: hypothetical protein V7606_4927 [Burkholderiales bacterium]
MGILDSVLRRRESVAVYRTVDGGHPAPYPDMTDEQLYNYEIAFDVPRKTFDKPPVPPRAARHQTRVEPELEPLMRHEGGTAFDAPPVAAGTRQEPGWHANDHAVDASAASAANEEQDTVINGATTDTPPPEQTDKPEVERAPVPSGDPRPLDLSKPVRTVTTRQRVEIITTRARHPIYKVHGYIEDADIATVFTLDGQLSDGGARFLENVPDENELYLNIYPNHDRHSKDRYVVTQHASREEADAAAGTGRVACVKADFNR